MKKLMIAAAGAVALASTAFADATSWFDAGIGSTSTWAPDSDGKITISGQGTWDNATNAELTAAAPNSTLEVFATTDAPLTFTAAGTALDLGQNQVEFSSKVEYTPFEALPEVPADAKCGVVAVKDDYFYILGKNEGEATNSWIKTDLETTNIAVTTKVLIKRQLTASSDGYKAWYTLDIGDKTNEQSTVVVLPATTNIANVGYVGGGVVSTLSATKTALSAYFKLQASDNDEYVDVTVSIDGTTVTTNSAGFYTGTLGGALIVTYKAKDGYYRTGGDYKFTSVALGDGVTIDTGVGDEKYNPYPVKNATTGEYYTSMDGAIGNAAPGNTIKICYDNFTSESGGFTVSGSYNCNLTIDLNNVGMTAANGFELDGDVTGFSITNGTMTTTEGACLTLAAGATATIGANTTLIASGSSGCFSVDPNATLTIIGGSFSSNPENYVDANNYKIAYDEGTALYTVTAKAKCALTVKADTGVASASIDPSEVTEGTETSVEVTAAASTGYTLTGVYTGDTQVATFEKGKATFTVTTSEAIEYTVKASINTYEVKFFADSEKQTKVGDTQNVNHGEKAVAPAAPTKTGYTFNGWDPSTNNAITAATDFIAQWTTNQYYVTYYTNEVECAKAYYNYGDTTIKHPTVEGVSAWSNSTYTAAFEFNGTIADNTQTAYAKIQSAVTPVTPGEPIPSTDPSADAQKINEGGTEAKKSVINPPTGATVPDSYYDLFTAVPGTGSVTMELNAAGTNAVVAAEAVVSTNALDAVLSATAGTTTDVTIAQPLAGFYYSFKQGTQVGSIDYRQDSDKNKVGGKDTISFTVDKPSTATSGFYQTIVSPAPQD